MSASPVIFAVKLRASIIDGCGLPKAGPANRLVTDAFVEFTYAPEMKAAEDREQNNGAAITLFSERTPATRKWNNLTLKLAGVDPDLYSMLTGWPRVLDAAGKVVGFKDSKALRTTDTGVAIELWTKGKSSNDCPTPDDSLFTASTGGVSYGYWLMGSTEWQPGTVTLNDQYADFDLTGRSISMLDWGRGPYNPAASDASGTPARLLTPLTADEHVTYFRTPVPPPANTGKACPLGAADLLTSGAKYFGPSAVAVMPDQPACAA